MVGLEIIRRFIGPVPVYELRGELDHCTVADAEKYFEAEDFAELARAVFDLRLLFYVNSACASVIMPVLTQLRAKGGDLKFCGVHGKVRDVFDLLGLSNFLDFDHETPEEAIAAFEKANPAEWMSVVREIFIGPAKGDKFHLGSCRFASRIADAERVIFESRQAAVDAGRRPCKNCKP